jgi:hypothetical protein
MEGTCSSEKSVDFQWTTCVVSQMVVLFITTAARAFIPTGRYRDWTKLNSILGDVMKDFSGIGLIQNFDGRRSTSC